MTKRSLTNVAAPVTAPHGAAPAAKGLGRFKPYPAYKDSDVEWLGPIPAHWEIVRLKRVCTLAYGEALPGEARGDGDIEVYGSNGPVGTHGQANTLAPSLVIGRKGSFGKVNFSYSPVFAIDTTFFVDRRFTKADIRWLYYVLSDARLDRATKDSAVPGLDREDAYAREVCLCPSSEQRAIAAFLDRETAKIDALVAKKERLISLLQEKRTAVISHAVTKGLDPTVPMKDSGVEWLGPIPAHWQVKRLRFVAELNPSYAPAARGLSQETEVAFVPMETLGEYGGLDLTKTKALRDVATGYTCFADGDVLLAKITPCFENGKGALAVGLANGIAFGTTELHVLRPRPQLLGQFLAYLTYSRPFRGLGQVEMKGAAGQQRVPEDFVKNFTAPVPPLPEQRAIAAFLDQETARIDGLIAKVREAIERLKEYRTALISAAVTGKIDVRELGSEKLQEVRP